MTELATSKSFFNGFFVGNLGTTETEFKLFSLEPGLMGTDGDYLEISARGRFAKNNNSKYVKLKFGNTVVFDSGAVTSNGGKWEITVTVTRTGETSETAAAALLINGVQQATLNTTPSETTASEIPIQLSGKGTVNKDVIGEILEMKYFRYVS